MVIAADDDDDDDDDDQACSYQACAREIDASHSLLYALLGGSRNIPPLWALKLAKYFDVPLRA